MVFSLVWKEKQVRIVLWMEQFEQLHIEYSFR
jgi:hypothetical protein